jgi:hypothetical protein
LEHLSIVDVVQLLHSTRKSGTLSVTSAKGECQLVFDDGYIISANHFDNSLRIGRILVEAGAVSAADLERTLAEQAAARGERKPLVAALIESGRVKKEDAYRGLETLLELTIVEVLTWTSGHFDLDVGSVTAADDYRYFPEKLHQGIQFHTENVLMDALRIYDEKKRDGRLTDEVELTDEVFVEAFGGGAPPVAELAGGREEEQLVLSADDLGLEDIDRLDRRIPEVFKPLEDRSAAATHRRALASLAPGLPEAERERLAALIDALPPRPRPGDGPPLAVILYGGDDLFAYCASAACRHEGIHLLSTSEERDLDPLVAQCRAKAEVPVLVLDAPGAAGDRFAPEALADLRRRARERHPGLCAVQLVAPGGPSLPASPAEGVTALFARPAREIPRAAFVETLEEFLAAFPTHLRAHVCGQGPWVLARVRDGLDAVRGFQDGSSVALALLRTVAASCERALTLVVRGRELISERGIGLASSPGREPLPLPGAPLRLPLAASPLLTEAVEGERCRLVEIAGDDALRRLQARIGAPRRPVALLVPLRAAATTVSLTYADFGQREPAAVDLALIETLAAQAGLALERILYRRRAEKAAP